MAQKLSKYGSALLGFILVCIGIGAFAMPAPPLGIHPASWFVLAALLFSDSAWTHVARKSYEQEQREAHQQDLSQETHPQNLPPEELQQKPQSER